MSASNLSQDIDDLINFLESSKSSEVANVGVSDDICLQCGCQQSTTVENKSNESGIDNTREKIIKMDIHCHILPKNIPHFAEEFGYGGFIHLEHHRQGWAQMWKDSHFFREVDEKCWSPEARLEDMNKANVRVQCLSTVPVMFSYWAKPEHTLRVATFLNDHIAGICQKYPKRFVGLGTLPMQHTKLAVAELHRCVTKLGFCGVQIGSHIEKWNLDNERFYPLWEAAEKLGACIFVHPWDMMGKPSMERYWLPWLVGMPAETSRSICSLMFGGVFKKYPKLKFCFAHCGGSFLHTVGRVQHGYDCRPDLIQIHCRGEDESPMAYLGHFWVDSLAHNHSALQYAIETVGINRMVMGTDYPFPLGECYPLKNMGELVETHKTFSEKEKKRILWDNCCELIGRQSDDFVSDK